MTEVIRFGIDIAKNVFHVHGVDSTGAVVVNRRLSRSQVEKYFAKQAPVQIGLEACGSSHYWGRALSALGHDVRLMPTRYVKPYVKRNKNDARDAEAICEAVSRPTMRFVPIKTVDQQCARALHRGRDLLIDQRTQLTNAIRSQLYELGVIASKGVAGISKLIERIEGSDPAIPQALLASLRPLARQWRAVAGEIAALDKQILQEARQDPVACRLMAIRGVGPITAHAVIAAIGDGRQFDTARDFAAWVGLTRRNHDTGGKHRQTGHISRAGDRSLRRLLVLGASSWLRQVRAPTSARPAAGTDWIRGVLARRPVKVAVVAQAAKNARIIWALLTSGQTYRVPAAA